MAKQNTSQTDKCNAAAASERKAAGPLRLLPRCAAKAMELAAFGVILALFVTTQVRCFTPAHIEDDIDAYVWLAKRMANLQPLSVEPEPFRFHGHPYVQTPDGKVTVKYAPGGPAAMAVAYRLVGDKGVFLVSPIAGGLTLIGAYLLFGAWMGPLARMLALATLAGHEMFQHYSSYPLTHALDACMVVWGMYFLTRWSARAGTRSAVGTGLCLGYAACIRHTNVMLGACVLAAVVAVLVRRPRPWRSALVMTATYAVFPAAMAVYNALLFGRPWITGYALSDEQGAFSLAMLAGNFQHFLTNAVVNVYLLTLPLGVLGAMMLGSVRQRAINMLWVVPALVLYGCYYWYVPYGGFFRFVLPVLPALVGLSYALLDGVKAGRGGRLTGMALLAAVMFAHSWQADAANLAGHSVPHEAAAQVIAANQARNAIAADAVIFTRDRFTKCLPTQRNYVVYDLDVFSQSYGRNSFPEPRDYDLSWAQTGRIPPRRQPSRTAEFRQFYEGKTDKELAALRDDLIRRYLDQGRQVVALLPVNGNSPGRNPFAPAYVIEPLTTFEVEAPYLNYKFNGMSAWCFYAVRPALAAAPPRPDPASEGLGRQAPRQGGTD